MATSNKVFVSPGVYTSERDLSFVAQSVASNFDMFASKIEAKNSWTGK